MSERDRRVSEGDLGILEQDYPEVLIRVLEHGYWLRPPVDAWATPLWRFNTPVWLQKVPGSLPGRSGRLGIVARVERSTDGLPTVRLTHLADTSAAKLLRLACLRVLP